MAGLPTELLKELEAGDLPILARSARELAQLATRGERSAPNDIADVVLRDPFFTLNVLRTISARKQSRLSGEVTTIDHAIMMFGVRPFMERFRKSDVLDDRFHADHAALLPLRRAMSRAHHAACQARDWAIQRADMESEEVYVAASLNEIAELLLLLVAPKLAAKLTEAIRRDPLGTAQAQRQLLGFELRALHQAITATCKLPELLCELMDPHLIDRPRVLNVQLAASLARHTEFDWQGDALHADIEAVASLLHSSTDEAMAHIHRTAVLAARAWQWYMAPPAARWLPLLPEPKAIAPALDAAPAFKTAQEAIVWTVRAMQQAGLTRVVFAQHTPLALKGKLNLGVGESPLARFEISLGKAHLFTHLMNKPQSVWFGVHNRDNLGQFVTGELTQVIGQGDFFATSLFVNGKPFALLYADRRGQGVLDESVYHAFKQIGARLNQALPVLMTSRPAQAST